MDFKVSGSPFTDNCNILARGNQEEKNQKDIKS